jgi:hypothetical protein
MSLDSGEHIFGAPLVPRNAVGNLASEDDHHAFLRKLAARPAFGELLDSIIHDDECLKRVAQGSYEHTLGFDKIVIRSKPPFARLRLHIWWPCRPHFREHAHNHRYASSSIVVVGRLRTYSHSVGGIGQPVTAYREGSASADQRWTFTEAGRAWLKTIKVGDFGPGDSYSMSADLVHHVDAPTALTATLFLEGCRVRKWSDVYVRVEDPAPSSAEQRVFRPEELRDRLVRLREVSEGFL